MPRSSGARQRENSTETLRLGRKYLAFRATCHAFFGPCLVGIASSAPGQCCSFVWLVSFSLKSASSSASRPSFPYWSSSEHGDDDSRARHPINVVAPPDPRPHECSFSSLPSSKSLTSPIPPFTISLSLSLHLSLSNCPCSHALHLFSSPLFRPFAPNLASLILPSPHSLPCITFAPVSLLTPPLSTQNPHPSARPTTTTPNVCRPVPQQPQDSLEPRSEAHHHGWDGRCIGSAACHGWTSIILAKAVRNLSEVHDPVKHTTQGNTIQGKTGQHNRM